MQVVWFKRDLRVSDHEALYQASCLGPVLCCYVIEDQYWQLPDTSDRHWQFIRSCLDELASQLAKLNCQLLVFKGEVCFIFAQLYRELGEFVLHSHQETGNGWTYQRDKAVAAWCRQHAVQWREYAQHAVLRGNAALEQRTNNPSDSSAKKSVNNSSNKGANKGANPRKTFAKRRKDWREQWLQFAKVPLWPKPQFAASDIEPLISSLTSHAISPLRSLPLVLKDDLYDCPFRQMGGRSAAVALLKSFLAARGERYQATISSPQSAETGCSRLSPYLAYGTVSIRELLHQLDRSFAERPDHQWRKSLKAFQSRLVWHCHFIQKLETNPKAEFSNMQVLYNALDRPWHAERFAAWQHGNTGWPIVDACMRYLIVHGWINFRMRAMLVSVACYTLKLPWQPVAQWLAQLFVDYEPGIHYPQIQMQSGTNGNQVLRIYNPLSQAQELDPDGVFVRRWVNELQHVPTTWIFAPDKMPIQLKQQYGSEHYPAPLVDFVLAHRAAKQEISVLRQRLSPSSTDGVAENRQFSLFQESS